MMAEIPLEPQAQRAAKSRSASGARQTELARRIPITLTVMDTGTGVIALAQSEAAIFSSDLRQSQSPHLKLPAVNCTLDGSTA
jgi:hypothetical protein